MDTPPDISRDDLFHILSNQRRRAVLRDLAEREGPVEMRTLAERIAAREHDTTVNALDSTQRQRVYISLYQNHLPKLATHGIIEYDQSRGRIEPTPLLAGFVSYLDDRRSPAMDARRTTLASLREGVSGLVREVTSVSAITGGLVLASRIVPTRVLTVLAMVAVVLIVGIQRLQ
ncbi:hypothetical protein [Halalkalicoccus sp. NIPERK01]|uniref:DUF7344 domain-containing protein n=1 Tax=Halalkalicoccus sp. NIPERK01 TaxID=3053469 RepID=UPI00256F008E|nr:hypothetical protein [Halalkalicoccus sp. NIPERK01]MDL5363314.1 hypothetical protein [Halalkalicoccus sp. NIPERK01]